MDYQAFKNEVLSGIKDIMGEGVRVECNNIKKNNGIVLQGISISQEKSNLMPTIYLEDFYDRFREGRPVNLIVYDIVRAYEKYKMDVTLDLEFFQDYGQMKNRIVYKLIHREKNKELLKEIPHILFLDLAIVFYCMVFNDSFPDATVLINNKQCEIWGKGSRDLFSDAQRNTPRLLRHEIRSMEDIMREIFAENLKQDFRSAVERNLDSKIEFEFTEEWIDNVAEQMVESVKGGQEEIPMYVLSNYSRIFGAACILYPGVLKNLSERFGEDIFILPSSVHEVILVPAEGGVSNERLSEMVKEVNGNQVTAEEVLSDEVYLYSSREDKIRMKSGIISL